MAPKTCTVSVTDASGSRHSVEVLAESLYEAAALGLKLLRDADWVETFGPMTRLQLQVRAPTVMHEVTIQQLQRWLDASSILHAYAWVVVRRIAALRIRHDHWAVASATLAGTESEIALRDIPAGFATSEQIYNDILCKELLAHLDPIEQQIAKAKNAGQSDDEIARGCGTSRRTIFNAWRRLKRKMLSQAQGIGQRPGARDWKRSRIT